MDWRSRRAHRLSLRQYQAGAAASAVAVFHEHHCPGTANNNVNANIHSSVLTFVYCEPQGCWHVVTADELPFSHQKIYTAFAAPTPFAWARGYKAFWSSFSCSSGIFTPNLENRRAPTKFAYFEHDSVLDSRFRLQTNLRLQNGGYKTFRGRFHARIGV